MLKKHKNLIISLGLILFFVLVGTLSYSSHQTYPIFIDSPESTSAINYSTDNPISFDSYADKLSSLLMDGIKYIKPFSYFLLSTLFTIQLLIDISNAYATSKIEEIFKIFFLKTFTFALYISVIGMIFNGTIFTMASKTSYKLVEILSDQVGVQKIDNIWSLKNLLTDSLFRVLNELKFFGFPSTVIKSILMAVFIIMLILIINIMFFMIMVDVFKLIIGFMLCLNLSTIFMPLGIFKESSEVYSISKVLSLTINFIVKIVSINVFAIIGIKAIKESGIIEKVISTSADTSITSFIAGDFMSLIMLIFIVTIMILKVDVSF